MSEISLRAYIDYIEDRLDRDAYSEVVAQCRHVLSLYPRYIPAYRLLGRALLEQENNQDALDLFQRVLSAEPSDFVAHVGMSECYHEQGALDQAIWHLERAFEQAPSNLDLQDEIKRLYAERDGEAPGKIPLSAGALARLYAKGDLHRQAILEIEKALSQDPERLDLQTLLADVLWQSHQQVEAGNAAARVLKRLPNSIVANRLLAQLWLRADKPDEAEPFLERLRALDPYAAYRVEQGGEDASADAFTLEMFDVETGQTVPLEEAASWVSQIPAVEKEKGVTGPLNEPRAEQPGGEEASAVSSSIDMDALFGGEEARGESAEPGEPDWLDEVLSSPSEPPTSTEELSEQPVATGQWLDAILGRDAENVPVEDVPDEPPAAPEAGDDVPDWLAGATAVERAPTAGTGDLTDEEEPPPDLPPEEAEREAPEWLDEILGSSPQPEASGEPAPPEEPAPGPAEVVSDSWLDEIIAGDAPPDEMFVEPEAEAAMVPPAEPDDVPDWIRELDEESDAELDVTTPEEAQPLDVEEAPAGPPAEAAGPDDDLPDWLQPPQSASAEAEAGAEEPPAAAAEPDVPDWLRTAVGPDAPVAGTPEPEETSDEAPPDWLAAPEAAAEGEEPALREDKQVAPPTDEPTGDEGAQDVPEWLTEGDLDSDDAVEWLEQLASKYDPDFQRSEGAEPGEEEVAEPAPAAEMAADEEPIAEAETEEDLPDWMRGEPAQEAAADAAVPRAEASDRDFPDWLMADEEVEEPAAEVEPAAEAEPVEEPEEVPDWMEEPPVREPEPVAGVAPDQEPEEGLPDWLLADEEEGEVEEAAPEPEPAAEFTPEAAPIAEAETEEDLPDWLKGEPSEAGEDMEWLREPAEDAEAVPAASAEDEALPDWMLADEEEEPVMAAEGEDDETFAWLDEQVREQGVSPEDEVVSEALEPDRPAMPAMAAEDGDAEPVGDEDLPDWMRDAEVQDQMARARETEGEAAEEEDLESELAELAEVDTGDLSWLDSALEAEESAVSEDELAELFADEDIDTGQLAAMIEEGDEDLPDWLKETKALDWDEAEREFEEMRDEDEAVPDWLSDLGEEEPAAEPAGEALEAAPAPDFEVGEAAEDEDLPDWLAGLGEPVEAAEVEEAPEPVAEAEPAEAEVEAEAEPEPEEEAEPAEIPDWMEEPPVREPEPVAGVPPAGEEEEEEIPDWLMPAEPAEAEAEAVEEEEPLPPAEPAPTEIAEPEEVEPVFEAEVEVAEVEEAPEPVAEEEAVEEEEPLPVAEPEPTAIAEPEEVEPVEPVAEEPAVEPEPEPEPEPAVVVEGDFDEQLRRAREKLEPDTIGEALPYYENLVGEGQMLEQTVSDLRYVLQQATEPDPRVSRTLGDALRKQGSLQEALEAYRSALDALE